MSLGGGALRRNVLSDSTSRMNTTNNASVNGRLTASSSLSQDDRDYGTPLKSVDIDDGIAYGSTTSSNHRSSSAPRRQSFGGSGLLSRSNTAAHTASTIETPIRDRRAMLEAWRKARGGDACGGDPSSVETRKRTRGDPPPLPPSSKQHRTTLSQDHVSNASAVYYVHQTHHNHHPTADLNSQSSMRSNQTIDYYDNDIENRIAITARTPSSRQGTMGSARRKSLMGRNIYHVNEGTILNRAWDTD